MLLLLPCPFSLVYDFFNGPLTNEFRGAEKQKEQPLTKNVTETLEHLRQLILTVTVE